MDFELNGCVVGCHISDNNAAFFLLVTKDGSLLGLITLPISEYLEGLSVGAMYEYYKPRLADWIVRHT